MRRIIIQIYVVAERHRDVNRLCYVSSEDKLKINFVASNL